MIMARVSASSEAAHEYLIHQMYDVYLYIITTFNGNLSTLIIPNQFALMALKEFKSIYLFINKNCKTIVLIEIFEVSGIYTKFYIIGNVISIL